MSEVVTLDRLTLRYGGTLALDEVTLSVSRGNVYALLGRNGAGKTSAVRCLLGLVRAVNGRAFLFGDDVWRHRARLMARVGVVPEEPDLPPEMTPTRLLTFCGQLYPRWNLAGARARLVRLGVPLDVRAGRLSRGQKAQLGLTLALGHAPDLLVLDDPTLGLDVVARREFFGELCAELAERQTTVVMTTHDLQGVEGIADRVGIVRRGRLVVDADLETLKQRYRHIRLGSPLGAG
jgi:ABC-2 type transport system ATP-binding protein